MSDPPRPVLSSLRKIIELIFPPHCGGCDVQGTLWCSVCLADIRYVMSPMCARCGKPDVRSGLCNSCRSSPLVLESIRSMALFDGAIRRAIHAFKYRHVAALGEPLGNILAKFWQQVAWPVDVIVPVPLHSHRQRERGYNQAALLAQGLVRAAHLPLRANALQRVRATASQMTLDAVQRRSNVNAAFRSDDNGLRGKRVLLVDDVCTTGATLNACAVALKSAGAVEVWGLTLARTA